MPDAPTTDAPRSTPSAVDEFVGKVKEQVTGPILQRIETLEEKQEADRKALEEHRQAQRDEINKLADARRAKAGLPGYQPIDEKDPNRSFSLMRAAHGHAKGWEGDTKKYPEYEVVHEYRDHFLNTAKKDGAQAGIGTSGGLLVSTTMMPDVIPELLANSVALAAGVEFLDGLSGGPISIPREEGGITAYRKGEGLPITESSETYSNLELRPLEVTARTRASKLLLLQTQGRVQTLLERKLARKLALKMDLDFFTGGGGNTPLGILEAPAPASATTSFASVDYLGADQTITDLLDDMVTGLKARNAYYGFGDVLWFANPQAFSKIRKSKDADGKNLPIFDRVTGDTENGVAQQDRMWGHRYAETTQLTYGTATDHLLLFPVLAAVLAMWDTLEIFPSEHADGAYENNELAIRAVAYNDSAIYRGAHVQRAGSWDNT